MYQQNDGKELVIDVGEFIDYESYDGQTYEGEVLEVSPQRNQVKVLRCSDIGIIEPIEWVSVENIFLRVDSDAID